LPRNLVRKILEGHVRDGSLTIGQPIRVLIDQTLTHDMSGPMAMMEYDALGAKQIATDISVNYVDHNMMQLGFENADDHEFLRTFSAKHGMFFSKPGNGICHQVHLERFSKPGKTLLGADSHTPTCGAVGMMAIGAGGLDVACAMAGIPFRLTYPKVCRVELVGQLQPFVTAKDLILEMLRILSTRGNTDWILEYGGMGVENLTVPQRATICNMGTEIGVITSLFPSDKMTLRFLIRQGRKNDWRALQADKGADYDRWIEIDLTKLEPMIACPHSPDNVKTVRELKGQQVNQVCIGSCTNSSYEDLMRVAALLKGQSVCPTVSAAFAPGSRQVFLNAARKEAIHDIVKAGVRVDEIACGFCIGAAQAPQTDAVSVRTSNRNYEGRSGTRSAKVYLTSPETAAACSLTGQITDPRDLGLVYPQIDEPDQYEIDDSMILKPATDMEEVKIFRGPNIVKMPPFEALPDLLQGSLTIKVGDNITTDHIMPAGRLAIYRSNIPKYAGYVFNGVDGKFAERCLRNKESGEVNFIMAGESYGQGSAREHAALCPRYLNVRAVLAKSIERIHQANLCNFGILPLLFQDTQDYNAIEEGDKLIIQKLRGVVAKGKLVIVRNETKKTTIKVELLATEQQREAILAGGLLNLFARQIRTKVNPRKNDTSYA